MDITHKSARTMLKDYQKHKMDIEERIRQNMLAKQKKVQEKERDAIKRTRTIIAELQECGGEWSLKNFQENVNWKRPIANKIPSFVSSSIRSLFLNQNVMTRKDFNRLRKDELIV